jgi:hypothetical protein
LTAARRLLCWAFAVCRMTTSRSASAMRGHFSGGDMTEFT